MDLDIKSAVGEIIPDVAISRITLETKPVNVFKDNPHIEAEGDVKVPYKPSNSRPLKVTLDIMMRDILENSLVSTWATNFDFNKYLRVALIQVRDQDTSNQLHQKRSVNKKEFLSRVKSLKNSNTIGPDDHVIIDLRQDAIANDQIKILNERKFINSTGQEIMEFGFSIVFGGVLNDNPPFLEYFAWTYIDLDELSNDFDIDLTNWIGDVDAIPAEFIIQSMGEIKSTLVFKDGSTMSAAKYYTKNDGTIWNGAIYFMQDGTVAGRPDGTIPLTGNPIPNLKLQDFRARDAYFKDLIDMSFVDRKFFAPLVKMKIAAAEDIVPAIKPAFFSDLMTAKDHNGNIQLFFSADMESIFRYNSKFGSFTNAFIGNPLKKMLGLSDITSMKIFRREVDPNSNVKDNSLGGKNHYKSISSDTSDKLVGYSVILNEKINIFSLDENSEAKSFIPSGKEIPLPSIDNKNTRHFMMTDFFTETDSSYQYRIEFEFIDGGFQYFSNLYNTIADEYVVLDDYAQRAYIPGAFDHSLKKFSTEFTNQNQNTMKDHIAPLIAKLVELATTIAAAGPEDKTLNYVNLSQLLTLYSHPHYGTISGIELLRTMVIEAMFNLEKILEIKGPTIKSSQQDPAAPSATSVVRRPKINYEFASLVKATTPLLGYDFLSVNKTDTTQKSPAGLKMFSAVKFKDRANQEITKYFKEADQEIEVNLGNTTVTTGPAKTQYAYFTPSYVFLKEENPQVLVEQDPAVFKGDKFLDLSISIILNNMLRPPTLGDSQKKLEILMAEKGGRVLPQLSDLGITLTEIEAGSTSLLEASPVNVDQDDLTASISAALDDKAGANQELASTIIATIVAMDALSSGGTKVIKSVELPSWMTFPLENYEINSPNNVFAREDFTPVAAQKHFINLPNQIKALFVASTEGPASNGPSTLAYNPFADFINPLTDAIRSYMFFFNYQNLARVEVLTGYEKSADGKNRNFLSNPKFKVLNDSIYNANAGKTVLCRLVRHVDDDFVKPFNEKFMELPFYNGYFLLSLAGNAVTEEVTPPEPEEVSESVSQSIDSDVPTEAVMIVPAPATIAETPPGTGTTIPGEGPAAPVTTPPKAGGGY